MSRRYKGRKIPKLVVYLGQHYSGKPRRTGWRAHELSPIKHNLVPHEKRVLEARQKFRDMKARDAELYERVRQQNAANKLRKLRKLSGNAKQTLDPGDLLFARFAETKTPWVSQTYMRGEANFDRTLPTMEPMEQTDPPPEGSAW